MATFEDPFLANRGQLSETEFEEDDAQKEEEEEENETIITTLECLAPHAVHYARVVKRVACETNLNMVQINDLLPIDMVNTASTILVTGKPPPKDVQEKTIEACDLVIDLDSSKKKVLEFAEIKTRFIAPNLSAVFVSKVATKLIISAGDLSALAKMPPIYNVHQHVGQRRKKSFVGSLAEILNETEIVQNTPPKYQKFL
ncbi:Nop domain [Arabidopsis suecica]|uniref:Nop domain n=1 Tax=Arabidopsis suecica TaxID=45249 RepID=A0A8T2B462_ARASU|nr:Nop domain [Arabidopsis suecica]